MPIFYDADLEAHQLIRTRVGAIVAMEADLRENQISPCPARVASNKRPGAGARRVKRPTSLNKKTLGSMIKNQRKAFGLTQRRLAERLGVKAAHVAYLELNQRRPSISLLGRIADVLGLERQPLFVLAHPEAGALLTAPKKPARSRNDKGWRDFRADNALLKQHRVSPRELQVLFQVSLLGKVSTSRQFLFILNSIRHAIEE
jgi:transcriptional regulator with XRE-family HTH domain